MNGESPNESKFVIGGILLAIVVLVGGMALLASRGQKGEAVKNVLGELSLSGRPSSDQSTGLLTNAGKYQDEICGVSFAYPEHWVRSDIRLPLPQEPLSQVTFNEPGSENKPAKNSILSYICYDAGKYSFDQFVGQNTLGQQTEVISVGQTKWQRVGNFIYTTRNDKLLILQMFFTKYDLNPETGYEETFLQIIKSVRFAK